MAREDAVNRVGLGVDLQGGADTITQLRTIRSEMQGIASVAGGIPKNIGGSVSSYVDPNQASLFDKEMARQGDLFGQTQIRQTRAVKEQLTERQRAFVSSEQEKRNEIDKTARYRKQAEDRAAAKRAPVTSEDVDQKLGERKRTRDLGRQVNIAEERDLLKREGIHKRINDNAFRTQKELAAAELQRQQGEIRHLKYVDAAIDRNIAKRNTARAEEYRQIQRDFDARAQAATKDVSGRSAGDLNSLRQQGRQFQRFRNDPARGEQDDIFRTDIARDLRATRNAQREREERFRQQKADRAKFEADRLAEEQKRIRFSENSDYLPLNQRINIRGEEDANRRREAEDARKRREERAKKNYDEEVIRDRAANVSKPLDVSNRLADANNTQRKGLQRFIGGVDPSLAADSRALFASMTQTSQKVSQLKAELLDVNRSRPLREIVADLNAVEREQRQAIQGFRDLKTAQIGIEGPSGPRTTPRGGRAGGSGGPGGPNLANPTGLLNERGFFTSGDALGRITRNILLYEVVSRATYGLVEYIGKSVEAAKTTVEFSNALRFATETAGGNLAANERLVESLRPIGLSRQQARAAVTEAARFTEERPEDIDQLTKIVSNIAAQRGGGVDRTDELIEQLRRRESKFYKRIFGTTVESIYESEAAKVVDKRVQVPNSLIIGQEDKEYQTRADQIKSYVAAMDDAARENAVLNYTLAQGARFEGEAAERATTLAGKLDLIAASFLNAQEGVGLFITEIKPLGDLITTIVGKMGALDNLRAPTLGRSGPGGTISDADVAQFGLEKTTGPRAKALETFDSIGVNGILGVAAIGAAGLFGRKKAQESVRLNEYNKLLLTTQAQFDGNMAAAQNHAIEIAKTKKAGFVRSVGAGFERITLGMTRGILDITTAAESQVAKSKAIQRAGGQRFKAVGQSFEDFNAKNTEALEKGPSKIQTGTAVAGGLIGGVAGAEIGSLIASQINAGPIIATTLTILGSVAGTALGTTAGSAVGGAIAGSIASAGGVGAVLTGTVSAAGILTAGAAIAVAAIAGIGIGTIINSIVPKEIPFFGRVSQEAEDQRQLKRIEAEQPAFQKQVKERNQAAAEGRIRYRSLAEGEFTKLLTGQDVRQRGDAEGDGKGGLKNYIEEIIPAAAQLKGVSKILEEFRQARDKILNGRSNDDASINAVERFNLNALEAKSNADVLYGTSEKDKERIEDYRKRSSERERNRVEEEQRVAERDRLKAEREAAKRDKAKQERITQQSNALGKLRDAESGGFRVVGDIANNLTGGDNSYVKVLADQVTVAERMRQQWGFLGKAAVEYFTILEQKAIATQLNKLSFDTFGTRQGFENTAGRERDARGGPGISRREQDYLNIQQAIVNQAKELPKLWQQAAAVMGQNIKPIEVLRKTLSNLQLATGAGADLNAGGNVSYAVARRNAKGELERGPELGTTQFGRRIEGFSAGARTSTFIGADGKPQTVTLDQGRQDDYAAYDKRQRELANQSPEVKRATEEAYADSAIEAIQSSGLTPKQLRAAGLSDTYRQALGIKANSLGRAVEDERKKANFNALEDERVASNLAEGERFRRDQLAKGINPRDVGKEADRYLLGRTEGINPKDLTYDQFEARQNALKNEARRTVEEEAEARAAVKKGLEYQESMNSELQIIREAILGGDVSMLVQVQNDTQARIDQEALLAADGKGYDVPLDQGGLRANPQGLGRYGRGVNNKGK